MRPEVDITQPPCSELPDDDRSAMTKLAHRLREIAEPQYNVHTGIGLILMGDLIADLEQGGEHGRSYLEIQRGYIAKAAQDASKT